MPNKTDLDRRKFLGALSLLLGAGANASLLSLSVIESALAYERGTGQVFEKGKLFNISQMQLLASVSDTILPETDSPSGAQLDCHGFVDHQLQCCFSNKQQQIILHLLNVIEQKAKLTGNNNFISLRLDEKNDLLSALESDTSEHRQSFRTLKELIVFGYFTSEVGATQVLSYQAIPGGYKGSIPLTPDAKAWGSLAFY